MDDVPVFSISPNPSTMFLTPKLKDAFLRFSRAIARKQGLCAILGANGLGKSTLLRFLALQYENNSRYQISYLPDSRKCGASAFSFLKTISDDFGIGPKRSQAAQLDAIETVLGDNMLAGRTTIVFVDEAQRLSLDTFEAIRAMLNYETNTHKMIQFVLAGQMELRDRFEEPRYRSIRSRIIAPLIMAPLTMEEMVAMIQRRLEAFSMDNPFTEESLRLVFHLSNGVPRNVLSLCQQAHDLAGERLVTREDIEVAHEGLQLAAREAEEQRYATAV